MNIIVVGGGMIGAALTYQLARQGADVTLLEATRPGSGTSGASFAWINAFRKEPRDYFELNRDGMREHVEVADRLGVGHLIHRDGGLHWTSNPEDDAELDGRIARLTSWGYRCDDLAPDEVVAEHEPDFDLRGVRRVVRTPDEGWVEAVPIVGALLRAARDVGARVRFPAQVRSLTQRGDVTEVVVGDGEILRADVVVLATGPATAQVAQMIGVTLPFHQQPGLLAYSRPTAAQLRHVVYSPGVHFRPDSGGRIVAGPGDHDKQPIAPAEEAMRTEAERIMTIVARWTPSFSGTPLEAYRIGVRPVPSDGLPIVDWLDKEQNVYAVTCHSGITMGQILGRLVAEEITGGSPVSRLEPYRLARFENTVVEA